MHREALRVVQSDRYDFVFIYYGSVDTAGHVYGWMEEGYLAQLKHVDTLVGELLAAIPADSHIVIQADHGGHERTHGTDLPEDMNIPWMAAGPTIKQGHQITRPVSLIDTAPTLARMLGIGSHEDWDGTAVDEMFTER
jgi:arylsulfatase A-like enzyme